MAAIIVTIYFWEFFANSNTLAIGLPIGSISVILASGSILLAVASYIWAPKQRYFEVALCNYCLLIALAASLILDTGELHSPFLALWMILGVFSGIFGLWGIGPYAMLAVLYLVMLFIDQKLGFSAMVTAIFSGLVPIVISYVVWHGSPKKDSSDQAYRKLANEFSQVTGKSEVVINGIADGVIAVDANGVIELINPAAQQIIGWGKQDALKLDYRSVLKIIDAKNNDIEASQDPVAQVLSSNKQVINNDLGLVTNSGKNILVSLLISPVGQIGAGAIIVFRDITREKAEERQQAEFISTASHEMRTPVASIEGYLGLALNPATAQIDEKARDYILKAHESAQHLGRLFQDLLDVSRADDGRLQNNPKVINLVEFAHDIVEGLQPKAEEKGLRLTYKPQSDSHSPSERSERGEKTLSPIYYVNVDPDHLREVIANLVENAIKYTPHGDVVVDLSGDTENTTLSVQDSGIGIPPEDVAHLFQKFYRVDNSETREIGGTGLGLYLCRRLTEAMNGKIWVESRYKEGSVFHVSLPRLANDEAQRLIEQSAAAATAPRIEIGYAQAIATDDRPDAKTTSSLQNNIMHQTETIAAAVASQRPSSTMPPIQLQMTPVTTSPQQPTVVVPPQQNSLPTQQPSNPAVSPTLSSQTQPIVRPQPFATTNAMPPVEKRPLGQPAVRPNTPLTAIEQNTAAYIIVRQPGVYVPTRQFPPEKP